MLRQNHQYRNQISCQCSFLKYEVEVNMADNLISTWDMLPFWQSRDLGEISNFYGTTYFGRALALLRRNLQLHLYIYCWHWLQLQTDPPQPAPTPDRPLLAPTPDRPPIGLQLQTDPKMAPTPDRPPKLAPTPDRPQKFWYDPFHAN